MGTVIPISPEPDPEKEKPNEEQSPKPEPTCHLCSGYGFHTCIICKKPHCPEHTSNVDISACSNCSEPVQIDISVIKKSTEEYNEWTDETTVHSYEAKNIHFSGQHWLNNAVIIAELTEQKLRTALEYHKGMIKMLEAELTARKISKARQAVAVRIRTPVRDVLSSVSSTKTVTEKRKRVPRVKTVDDITGDLLGAGVDPMKLLKMLEEAIAKKKLGVK